MERNTIVVYGASSQDVEQVFSDAAYRLGQLIAHSGKRLVSGAGATGLMAAVEDGVLSAGGTAIGIIPQFMVDNGWLHQGLTALPGGTGTFEELFEIITWKMLGLFVKPVIILNTDHYYDPLLQMLDCTADRGFMNPLFRKLWAVADDPDQAIALVDSIPDWNDLTTKLPTQK